MTTPLNIIYTLPYSLCWNNACYIMDREGSRKKQRGMRGFRMIKKYFHQTFKIKLILKFTIGIIQKMEGLFTNLATFLVVIWKRQHMFGGNYMYLKHQSFKNIIVKKLRQMIVVALSCE